MRIRPEMIDLMAHAAANKLITGKLVQTTEAERLAGLIRHVIVTDLEAEEKLDVECRELMEAQLRKLPAKQREELDPEELFRKMKKHMAEQRKLVIW